MQVTMNAGPGLLQLSPHLRPQNVVRRLDLALDLVDIDFGAAAEVGIRVDPEKVFGLSTGIV